jgi:hypothetical protein
VIILLQGPTLKDQGSDAVKMFKGVESWEAIPEFLIITMIFE